MIHIYKQMKELVSRSKTAVVVSHIDPDGDTLGSMVAMGEILEKMGLDVLMFSPDGIPSVYKFIPGIEKVVNHPPKKEFDLMVSVDASGLDRLGNAKINAKKVINIDHHPDNTNFGDINCVELLSAVGEVIYKIAVNFGVPITQEIAIALYVSIITDTGNFRYSNTLPSTFEIAKELVLAGANPYHISNQVYETKSVESLHILAATLNNLHYSEDKKIVWASVSRETAHQYSAKSEDFVGVIDHIRSIKECEVAVLFREEKNGQVKVNFRSKGQVNVSKIANELGGGGHVPAAGCTLNIPLDEAQTKVIDLVKKEL